MKSVKNTREKTIAGKITVRIALTLLIVFAVIILFVAASTRRELEQRELEKLELLAGENANTASRIMNTMLDKEGVISAALQNMSQAPPETKIQLTKSLMEDVGEGQDDILSLFFAAEPNTFLPETPNGFSVFVSVDGADVQYDRFSSINQEVYENALKSKSITIADPFKKEIAGKEYMVLTVMIPFVGVTGEVEGIVGSNIDVAMLGNAEYETGGYETFYNQIICGHQTVIMNSRNPENVGKSFLETTVSKEPTAILEAAKTGESLTLLDELTDGTKNYRAFVPFYVGNSTVPWLSGSSITEDELLESIISQVIFLIAISVAGMILLMVVCYGVVKKLLKPMAELEHATKELSKGNLQVSVNCKTNDEMGRLAANFNESVDTLYGYVADIDRAMNLMSDGDFNVSPAKPFIGDFSGIENAITKFIQNMCGALVQIRESSELVNSEAEQIAINSSALSQGSTEQAGSVEELTATIQDMKSQVDSNNENAKLAALRVQEAADKLVISNERMEAMTAAISEITDNSSQIGKIIKTIEDIAFQTNILALNAAVEAARAGEAGKGFAVVADEVRNLASKSAEAAKSTTNMIQNTITSVRAGADIAQEAADSLVAVQDKAMAVVSIVSEIEQSSETQKVQIETISASSIEISDVIQNNSAGAEESSASAEELASQAGVLKGLVRKFNLHTLFS